MCFSWAGMGHDHIFPLFILDLVDGRGMGHVSIDVFSWEVVSGGFIWSWALHDQYAINWFPISLETVPLPWAFTYPLPLYITSWALELEFGSFV